MHPKSRSIVLGGLMAVGLVMLFNVVGSLLGGALAGVFVCIPFVTSGLFAVWHYTSRERLTLTTGEGLSMGAQAGMVSFLTFTALLVFLWILQGRPSLLSNLDAQIRSNPRFSGSPAEVEQVSRLLASPAFMLGVIVVIVLLYVVAGLIGGAIGAAVFRKGGAAPPADAH